MFALDAGRRQDRVERSRAALEIAGRVRRRGAGRGAGHGRRRLLVGRTQRLSLREWPRAVAGRAVAHRHLDLGVERCRTSMPTPVIDRGRVYAVGQGGRMVALELVTGQRLWEQNFAGISTPWVAGEWLFVVTDDARLVCLVARERQGRAGSRSCRGFSNEKKQDGPDHLGRPGARGRSADAGQFARARSSTSSPTRRRRSAATIETKVRRSRCRRRREQHACTCSTRRGGSRAYRLSRDGQPSA